MPWPDVGPQVSSGSGTLLIEGGPKGWGCVSLVNHPHDEVDPEYVVPSWQQFEEQGWEAFCSSPSGFEALERWRVERLGAYEFSALTLAPGHQLAGLGVEARQRSVLVVPSGCEGCLSSRCA